MNIEELLSPNWSDREIENNKRFKLAFLWSFIVILSCYTVLFIGTILIGKSASSNFLVIEIYTYLPAIISFIFIFFFATDYIRKSHFIFPGLRWMAFGLFYAVIVLVPTIIVGFLLNELSFNNNYSPFSDNSTAPPMINPIIDIIIYLIFAGTVLLFFPGGFIRILGEEIGWRGYLLPELLKFRKILSIVLITSLVGLVWFIYHLPFFTYYAPVQNPEQMFYTFLGSIGVFFGANWAMCWTYLKTKNLWPALSLHYLWNLINPLLTGNLYSNSLGLLNPSFNSLWLVNGEGLIGGFFHFIVGLVFLLLIIKDKDKLFANYYEMDQIESVLNKKSKKKNLKRRSEKFGKF